MVAFAQDLGRLSAASNGFRADEFFVLRGYVAEGEVGAVRVVEGVAGFVASVKGNGDAVLVFFAFNGGTLVV